MYSDLTLHFFKDQVYLFVCVCMEEHVKVTFHHTSPGVGTKSVKLSGKHLYTLSHFAGPSVTFNKILLLFKKGRAAF